MQERQERQVQSLGWEDPLEKERATHSSILACKIPWTETRGRLQTTWAQRVGPDLVTKPPHLHLILSRYLEKQIPVAA